MLSWLSQNLATILITLLLVAIVAAIIIGMVRKSKKIKSSCSGGRVMHGRECAGYARSHGQGKVRR